MNASRWGGHVVGPLYLRAFDRSGSSPGRRPSRRGESCASIHARRCCSASLAPREPQLSSGNEVSRRKGRGHRVRRHAPWTTGDPLKRVNWRASARRGELWVNESHPERNTDVILFVDAFAEARRGAEGTLDLAARATAALADAYVGRRDRVGLISFGGILRWLAPELGAAQLYRVVDALLDTQVVLSYYWKEIDVIPRRTLPPNALVIALSPLLDPRSVGALLDLRARGHDLAVIDVSPIPFTHAAVVRPRRDRVRHVGASPRRAPAVAPALRGRGRRVARRRPAAVCARGGESISTARPPTHASDHRARVARRARRRGSGRARTCAASSAISRAPPPALALALLAFGLVSRFASTIPWSIVLVGRGVPGRTGGEPGGRRRRGRRRCAAAPLGRARVVVDRATNAADPGRGEPGRSGARSTIGVLVLGALVVDVLLLGDGRVLGLVGDRAGRRRRGGGGRGDDARAAPGPRMRRRPPATCWVAGGSVA